MDQVALAVLFMFGAVIAAAPRASGRVASFTAPRLLRGSIKGHGELKAPP
jgi:hypothetical protein